MKITKITYNPRGLKRVDNTSPKNTAPKKDINLNEFTIEKSKEHYWQMVKKK